MQGKFLAMLRDQYLSRPAHNTDCFSGDFVCSAETSRVVLDQIFFSSLDSAHSKRSSVCAWSSTKETMPECPLAINRQARHPSRGNFNVLLFAYHNTERTIGWHHGSENARGPLSPRLRNCHNCLQGVGSENSVSRRASLVQYPSGVLARSQR